MSQQAGEEEDFREGDGFGRRWSSPRLRAPRLRGGRGRVLRDTARLALLVAAFGCAAVGLFFAALARGPIPLDWLAPAVVESLDELYRGRYDFQLSGARIADSDHGPTITVEGLQVSSGGRVALAAPRAELSIDFLSLLTGRLKPRRIEALDLELRLSVAADGTISVSAGTDPAEAAPLRVPVAPGSAPQSPQAAPSAPLARTALLHQAGDIMRGLFDFATSPDSAIGGIDRIGVLHGRLVIDDHTVDRTISYGDLTLSLDRGRDGMKLSLGATDQKRRWRATMIARSGPGDRRVLDAEVHDLSIDEIALVAGLRNLKFDTDAPISANLHFALGSGGHVVEAEGGLRIGKGFFRLEDPDHEPVLIDAVSAAAHWDKASRELIIAPVSLKAGGFDMALKGVAAPPPSVAGAPPAAGAEDAWSLSLRLAKPTTVRPERAGAKPLPFERGELSAKLLLGEKKLILEKLRASGPDADATLTGSFDWAAAPHVAFALNVKDAQIWAISRLWPSHAAVDARNWMLEHIRSGVVAQGALTADYDDAAMTAMRYGRPPPDKAVRAEVEIANAELADLLPGLPPFTGVGGHLRVTGRTLSFAATAGAMETAPGRKLTLVEGMFSVPDNALTPTPAELDLRLAGNVEGVSDILATPGVSPHASLPLEPGALKGAVDGKVRVNFEIGAGARPDRTAIAIDALTQNLSIDRFVGAERLENAALSVVRDGGGLRVSGGGRLFGAPALLDLRRAAGDRGPAQALLTLTFDDAARAKSGFALPGVGGPVSASLKAAVPLAEGDAQIELDLTKTALDIPGLAKPAGKFGKASFVLARRNEGITLDQLMIDAGGAQINGVVDLTREGGFKSAKFSQIRLSPGDDAHVEAQRGPDAVKVTIRGANIDARPIIRALTQGSERAATPPPAQGQGATQAQNQGPAQRAGFSLDDIDIDFKSPIVSGFGKQILANVDMKLERRGGRLRAFTLSGLFGREKLAAAMPRNGAQLQIATADAGSFMSFLDFYQRMDSGALDVTLQLNPGRTDGALRIRDFYLKNEPAMRQLMTQGVARADDRGNIRFDPDSVRFSRLQTGFTTQGGTLNLREGVMSGPEIGLTFDGFIDFAHDRVDVSGAYVPAYGLNSLLSNIPVLGVVLAGGQHEGIFALNYRVLGPLGAPVVNVNPLSAIAPGLMRKIMGVMDGTGRPFDPSPPQAEQPQPQPPPQRGRGR